MASLSALYVGRGGTGRLRNSCVTGGGEIFCVAGIGRLTAAQNDGADIALTYDARGNVIADTRTIAGHTYTTQYSYDAACSAQTVLAGITWEPFGPASSFTYGNGLAENRSYDADGYLR